MKTDCLNTYFNLYLRFLVPRNDKVVLKLLFLFLSGLALGQTLESPQGIKANFSQKSIEAYQENSQNKLKEFYEYLNLYSKENNIELRKQIQSNIFSMVQSESIQVIDFTDSNGKLIDLSGLLKKIENQGYEFEVIEIESSKNISLYAWENSYQLKVSQGNHSEIRKISQTIQFEPWEKKFGSKSKLIWQIKLNEMLLD